MKPIHVHPHPAYNETEVISYWTSHNATIHTSEYNNSHNYIWLSTLSLTLSWRELKLTHSIQVWSILKYTQTGWVIYWGMQVTTLRYSIGRFFLKSVSIGAVEWQSREREREERERDIVPDGDAAIGAKCLSDSEDVGGWLGS